MSRLRHVNVFWREDGRCIFGEKLEARERFSDIAQRRQHGASDSKSKNSGFANPRSMSGTSPYFLHGSQRETLPTDEVSSSTIWSLVQVFIQFSREVDGGNVQKLVFRDQARSTIGSHNFGTPKAALETGKSPVLIHVAHNQLFAVTLTERLRMDTTDMPLVADQSSSSSLVQSVLRLFESKQAEYLRSSTRKVINPEQNPTVSLSGAPDSYMRQRHLGHSGTAEPESGAHMSSSQSDRTFSSSESSDISSESPRSQSLRHRCSGSSTHGLQSKPECNIPLMTLNVDELRTEVGRILQM